MLKIYFYPRVEYKWKSTPNPYILNFISSLSLKNIIVNKNFNEIGVLDLFKYLFKADIYLFNWIENITVRRFGNLQVMVFSLFLLMAKIVRKKIVWILHNKYTHNKRKNRRTDFLFNIMMNHSDLIITHSLEGIDFINEYYPGNKSKARYIIHPVNKIHYRQPGEGLKYDFLIWGVILPYKGILDFLKYVHDSAEMSALKILIVGKCPDEEYLKKIKMYMSENVVHFDKYYNLEEIAGFANQAKFTLFTYKPESVLSSGSLMDSIGMDSVIIGPEIGAFKDLSSYKFVYTYNSYRDIIEIYRNFKQSKDSVHTEIDRFCNENSWELFGEKISGEFETLL